jgi:hypothetical protein
MKRLWECDLAFLLLGPLALGFLFAAIHFMIVCEYGSPHWQFQARSAFQVAFVSTVALGIALGIRNRLRRPLQTLAVSLLAAVIAFSIGAYGRDFFPHRALARPLAFIGTTGATLGLITMILGTVYSLIWFARARPRALAGESENWEP